MVLEENPTETSLNGNSWPIDNNKDTPTHVLVLVKDERTLEIVRDYLVQGRRTLLLRWLRYLEQYNDWSRLVEDTTAISGRVGFCWRKTFGPGAFFGKEQHPTKASSTRTSRSRPKAPPDGGRMRARDAPPIG